MSATTNSDERIVSDADIAAVSAQAPAEATRADIIKALYAANHDVPTAVSKLWGVAEPAPPARTAEQQHWDTIRKNANEMTAMLNDSRAQMAASAPAPDHDPAPSLAIAPINPWSA